MIESGEKCICCCCCCFFFTIKFLSYEHFSTGRITSTFSKRNTTDNWIFWTLQKAKIIFNLSQMPTGIFQLYVECWSRNLSISHFESSQRDPTQLVCACVRVYVCALMLLTFHYGEDAQFVAIFFFFFRFLYVVHTFFSLSLCLVA